MSKCILFSLLLLLISSTSFANAIKNRQIKQFPNRTPVGLKQRNYGLMQKANTYITKEKYDKALETLLKLEERTNDNKFEHPQVLQNLAYIYSIKNQYKKSIVAIEKALSYNTLEKNRTMQNYMGLAQFYAIDEKYELSLKYANLYLSYTEKPNPGILTIVAQDYYQLKNFKLALDAINYAIELTPTFKEPLYSMKFVIEYNNKMFQDAAKTGKILIANVPNNATYWKQLLSVFLTIEDFKSALIYFQLAHKKNVLSEETQFYTLANLLYLNNIPWRAGLFTLEQIKSNNLKKNFKNLEFAASSLYSAHELDEAIKTYEQVAQFDETGRSYSILGQIYLDKKSWKMAIESFDSALKKGKLKESKKNVLLNRGVAFFHIKDYEKSLGSFQQLMIDFPDNPYGKGWITHLTSLINDDKTNIN